MKRIFLTIVMVLALTPLAYAQDAIQTKVNALGDTLGAAVSPERSVADGGLIQDFEKGSIYFSPKTGACLVKSDVLTRYKRLGAETGKLGYPVGDERPLAGGGVQQTFEHGFLRTTTTGDLQADILTGATLTADTVTINDSSGGILMGVDDGFLTIREVSGPEITLTCSCDQNPSPSSQRLGTCTLSFSNKNKTASCKNRDCNGSCAFETTSK